MATERERLLALFRRAESKFATRIQRAVREHQSRPIDAPPLCLETAPSPPPSRPPEDSAVLAEFLETALPADDVLGLVAAFRARRAATKIQALYLARSLNRLRGELLVADVQRGARTETRRWRPCTFFVDDHALCWESSRLPLVAVRSVAVRRAASAEFAIEASEREPLELRAASAEEMLRWVQKLRRGATEAARKHLRDFGWAPGRRRLLAATSEEELRAHEHVASPPAAAAKRRGWFG